MYSYKKDVKVVGFSIYNFKGLECISSENREVSKLSLDIFVLTLESCYKL